MIRTYALFSGIVCHLFFAVGVGMMMWSIYNGLQFGYQPFSGKTAVLVNMLLVLQFPFLHSFFLSKKGTRWLGRLAPRSIGRDLVTTNFAIIASLQLIVAFGLWSPSGIVWWEAQGAWRQVCNVFYGISWLVLLKAMADAGLALQTGFLGWSAVLCGKKPIFKKFPTTGLFRYSRQPNYMSFALILWSAPVWTPDRLALAIAWTAYCILGPVLKERRYLSYYGDAFRLYQREVSYWLPGFRRMVRKDSVV